MELNRKSFWIAMVVVFLLCVALLYVFVVKQREAAKVAGLQKEVGKQAEQFKAALQKAQQQTEVSLPSTNPLGNVVPKVSPLDKVNPFKNNAYQNPFE